MSLVKHYQTFLLAVDQGMFYLKRVKVRKKSLHIWPVFIQVKIL